MKKLIGIVAFLCCQLNASEQQIRVIKEFPGVPFEKVSTMLSDANASWHPDFLQYDRSTLQRRGQSWKVISAKLSKREPWCVTFETTVESVTLDLTSYFIRKKASAKLEQSYVARLWKLDFSERYENPVITVYSQISLQSLPRKCLTPLGKGLLAATAAGLGTALYYAYTRNRLTRNVSVDAILQEQKNGAQLPENQAAEISN